MMARTRAVFLSLCAWLVPSSGGDQLDRLLYYSASDPRPPGPDSPDFAVAIRRLTWIDKGKLEAEFVITKVTNKPGVGPIDRFWVALEWRFYSPSGRVYNRHLASVGWHTAVFFTAVATTDVMVCSVVPPPGAARCALCYGPKRWKTPTVSLPPSGPSP